MKYMVILDFRLAAYADPIGSCVFLIQTAVNDLCQPRCHHRFSMNYIVLLYSKDDNFGFIVLKENKTLRKFKIR